jgi:F420-dependent oxidoreductase-like protein
VRIAVTTRLAVGDVAAFDQLLASARRARDLGLELATPQVFDIDALTALAIVARDVPGLPVCVAVVPTFGRHPLVLAMQALTVQAATGNRLTLGVGLSHPTFVEECFGMSYAAPVRQMREYLEALMPLLHDGTVDYEGTGLTARTITPMTVPGAAAPPVLVAALGAQMLALTGRLADGTSLWMVGPKTLEDHVVPIITGAAEAAGRPRPQVQVGVPVCVTTDTDAARARAAAEFSFYPTQPSYRAMLDLEGAGGAADVAVVGDEDVVAGQLHHLEEIGATSIRAAVFGTKEEKRRTYELLASLARA